MDNLLTERSFWVQYWNNKKNIAVEIPKNYLFHQQISEIFKTHSLKNAIELGGFPGYYSVYLKKYYQVQTTLLDYFIHKPITEQLLQKNNLALNALEIIETDLFNYHTEKKYDLVLSCGLIEHFKDTKNIIQKHTELLSENGMLLITLPNFKSVNGWVQKTFDKANYDKHYIECMNVDLLKNIAQELG